MLAPRMGGCQYRLAAKNEANDMTSATAKATLVTAMALAA